MYRAFWPRPIKSFYSSVMAKFEFSHGEVPETSMDHSRIVSGAIVRGNKTVAIFLLLHGALFAKAGPTPRSEIICVKYTVTNLL